MQEITVINLRNNNELCNQAILADRFFLRLKGLLGKRKMQKGEGLIIQPCNMVHSLGMMIYIDVLFVGSGNQVVYCLEKMAPYKISPLIKEAQFVIELPSGTISQTETSLGDCVLCRAIK